MEHLNSTSNVELMVHDGEQEGVFISEKWLKTRGDYICCATPLRMTPLLIECEENDNRYFTIDSILFMRWWCCLCASAIENSHYFLIIVFIVLLSAWNLWMLYFTAFSIVRSSIMGAYVRIDIASARDFHAISVSVETFWWLLNLLFHYVTVMEMGMQIHFSLFRAQAIVRQFAANLGQSAPKIGHVHYIKFHSLLSPRSEKFKVKLLLLISTKIVIIFHARNFVHVITSSNATRRRRTTCRHTKQWTKNIKAQLGSTLYQWRSFACVSLSLFTPTFKIVHVAIIIIATVEVERRMQNKMGQNDHKK